MSQNADIESLKSIVVNHILQTLNVFEDITIKQLNKLTHKLTPFDRLNLHQQSPIPTKHSKNFIGVVTCDLCALLYFGRYSLLDTEWFAVHYKL